MGVQDFQRYSLARLTVHTETCIYMYSFQLKVQSSQTEDTYKVAYINRCYIRLIFTNGVPIKKET